jgi:very-short-patch-repair endonuclease
VHLSRGPPEDDKTRSDEMKKQGYTIIGYLATEIGLFTREDLADLLTRIDERESESELAA